MKERFTKKERFTNLNFLKKTNGILKIAKPAQGS